MGYKWLLQLVDESDIHEVYAQELSDQPIPEDLLTRPASQNTDYAQALIYVNVSDMAARLYRKVFGK
ncbi:MAG: hypothetical protein WC054_00980 [Candidatus Nanopelagicales bacterium]